MKQESNRQRRPADRAPVVRCISGETALQGVKRAKGKGKRVGQCMREKPAEQWSLKTIAGGRKGGEAA